MSLAMIRVRKAFAAAIASTPEPVPTIEHARARRRRLARVVERQQAAARGAVMAGAEGQRRLDLDADVVRLDAARGRARRAR